MRTKTYFFSDAHLGARTIDNPRVHELHLVHWLDTIKSDAKAIYMLGDILDYWFEYRTVVPRGFTCFFGKIAELTDSGIEVFWMIGNHDIWIFDYLPQEIGVQMLYAPVEVEIGERRFYLAHGDGLGKLPPMARFMRAIFYSKVCHRLYAALPPSWTVRFAHAWSSHSRKNPKEPADYMGEKNEYLVTYAKTYSETHPGIAYFIFGHRHIMLDLMIRKDCRVTMLGDWVRYFSYAVFDGDTLSLEQYEGEFPLV